MKKLITLFTFFFFLLSFTIAQQSGIGITIDKKPLWFGKSEGQYIKVQNPVSQFPPFCGKKLRQKGNSLSFPFGVGIQSMFMEQEFIASNLQLSNDMNDITATADTIYQNTVSGYKQLTTRLDVWLFSFLNIYGIVGYTRGQTSPDLTVPYILVNIPGFEPIVIDTTFEIHDELKYQGPTYGGGATLSAGYKSFFFVLDYNYTVTVPNDVYSKIYTHSFSPKTGIFLGKIKSKLSGNLWLGAMYLSNNQDFSGQINVSEIAPGLEYFFGEAATYSGNITAVNQWNMLIGASIVLANHHYLTVETGFIGRKQLMLMYNFRF
ncbi:MAG TPA: hypothetical protein VIN10_00680 [Bacteroidales bacterium]